MPPKRKRTVQVEAALVESEEPVTPTRRSPRKPKVQDKGWDPYANDSPLSTPPSSPPPQKTPRKRRKKGEPVVYDIPSITEFKTTNFEGRLGYACLNTVLRQQDPPVFCSRTCRLATLKEKGLAYAQELGRQNARDLKAMVQWNEVHGIRFMRMSSEMFPFASHKEWGYDLAYAQDVLAEAGALARKLGHRLTTHPGQFTQLASPKDAVIEASIRELEYHCQMMRYMGLGKDSVIILHMGGVYGDKAATIARFRETYTTRLTDEMRARLVLENDEMCYSADDLLPVCEELGIPIVLDYHHNYIKPSVLPLPALVRRINATWARKGIRVKQHLSEPRPGLWYNDWARPVALAEGGVPADADADVPAEVQDDAPAASQVDDAVDSQADPAPDAVPDSAPTPDAPAPKKVSVIELRAHADRCSTLPAELALMGTPFSDAPPRAPQPRGGGDLMIEAKDKEQAVFQLLRMYRLADVAQDVLRPERVAGGTRRKGYAVADVEEEGEGKPKRRARKVREQAQEVVEGEAEVPKKRGRAKKGAVEELVNQEDEPVPVDGALVAEVEAEEHPEVAEEIVKARKTRARKSKA
ncbi:UV-endonuclease UvdE [Phanerochaete sordida]|uniref:UV-endonuclease UvdE n=1 Tax=Phanerochaete sordida TaxID=48140 RepID=A0A9P3GEK9_9APHY|nr:UV-endonuclease UvdE [Phanerochaete sordida]